MTILGWPKTIAWSDFGKPVAKVPATYSGSHTDCHIEININSSFSTTGPPGGPFQLANIKITVSLDSHLSWVMSGVPTSGTQAAILSHEQGHYDIAGITARDVETALKALTDPSQSNLLSTANTTSDSIIASGLTEENTYDDTVVNGGTDHGNDATQQAAWKSKIAAAQSLSDLP